MGEAPCKGEILAPAGSGESLVAAVRSGADAVYLGGESFHARLGAANFDAQALEEAVRYCHARGVKVYQTLNTLVFDDELSRLAEALKSACAAGVDALIVQDLAVAELAKTHAPELPLHASTQMSVHNTAGVRVLEELGFHRVVLARELSSVEIGRISANCNLELECFVHGALCMSVSGQCYLSSMIGGRSGNRGRCAQPCRLPFSAGDRTHALSLKDLSLVDRIRELAAAGVCSFKIEGRMKRPEYVAAAVTACRRALRGEPPDLETLEAVFSRNGFTQGYFEGELGRGMFGVRRKEDVRSAQGVLGRLAPLYKEERQAVPVDFVLRMKRGKPAVLEAADRSGNRSVADGPVPAEAKTAPTTPERAVAALSKTGGTFFTAGHCAFDIDGGLMLPAAALNAMRREALAELAGLRSAPPAPYLAGTPAGAAAPPPLLRAPPSEGAAFPVGTAHRRAGGRSGGDRAARRVLPGALPANGEGACGTIPCRNSPHPV